MGADTKFVLRDYEMTHFVGKCRFKSGRTISAAGNSTIVPASRYFGGALLLLLFPCAGKPGDGDKNAPPFSSFAKGNAEKYLLSSSEYGDNVGKPLPRRACPSGLTILRRHYNLGTQQIRRAYGEGRIGHAFTEPPEDKGYRGMPS
jgi:hypothetical protein